MALDTTNNIIDLDLSPIKRKRFRINGDDSKILELNTSDMHILQRMQEVMPKISELQNRLPHIADDDTMDSTAKAINELDTEMRGLVDFLFDANVSEVCVDGGSMFDPIDGMFRFEYLIEALMKLYDTNLTLEFKKMKARINKYAKTPKK